MVMQLSENGLNLIKKFEGFSPTVYNDVAGKPTIGFGHLIKPNESFTSIDIPTATQLLADDAKIAVSGVNKCITASLNQNQFDALVSFCYNLGVGALINSTLRKKLNAGDYDSAQAEFMRWVFAAGVKQQGLVNRRNAESELFGTPC
jgi:lysozyme